MENDEVEIVGLEKELQLSHELSHEDQPRATAKAVVVDSGNNRAMVEELGDELSGNDGQEF